MEYLSSCSNWAIFILFFQSLALNTGRYMTGPVQTPSDKPYVTTSNEVATVSDNGYSYKPYSGWSWQTIPDDETAYNSWGIPPANTPQQQYWSNGPGLPSSTRYGYNIRPAPLSPQEITPSPSYQIANVPMQSPPLVEPKPFGYLSPEAREAMRRTCVSGLVNCKSQPYGLNQKRTMVLQSEIEFMRKENPYTSGKIAETRLDMTNQLKQKMLKVAGLGDLVLPEEDGIIEHDVLLTEYQSKALMDALDNVDGQYGGGYGYGGNGYGSNSGGYEGPRYKKASLFLEQMPTQRWDVGQPIPYIFDTSLAEYERNMIRNAHRAIEANTCIRFRYSASKPTQNYISYNKITTPTFCGLSYVGRVYPANPVYLTFMCQDPVGIAIHETMHALGANHEQLRSDRDSYLDINWANINPQFYDHFAISDPAKFTTYGIPYDYGSIMQYQAFTAAIDTSQPTMNPRMDPGRNRPLMGQRKRMSQRDIQLLNAMYCKGSYCVDTQIYCGFWALQNGCPTNLWLQLNCRKSCQLC